MTRQLDAQDPAMATMERTRVLFQMITGFRVTQMIHVAAKLGIADLLKDGPQDAEALAQATSVQAPSLYRLLRALAGMGIFAEDEQGRFALTPLAELLRADVPGSLRPQALLHGDPTQWLTWGDLMYSIATGQPAFPHIFGMDPWEHRVQNPELNAIFNAVMVSNTTREVGNIAASYDFSGIGTIVDVGGGHGALLAAILRANPRVRGILCDAPHVVEGARPVLEEAGVLDRVEITSCDFFKSVPEGGDTYILKTIIHDWDDEHALAILRTCRKSVPEGGRLLVVEHIIPPGNGPHPGKMLDLQMLVMFGARERSEAEYGALLEQAGFRLERVVPAGEGFGIIEARPV